MAMVNMNNLLNGKDSRWLQLEVCREFQRQKCSRPDTECKFAHPPANVEVQNGRVTACYDSIKGRCNREKPPCKYFHPPQHLKDQLLINGRNHLALKNALMQQMGLTPGQPLVPGQVPAVATNPYLSMPQVGSTYSPYYAPGPLMPAIMGPDPSGVASQLSVVPQTVVAQQKMPRSDRLEMDMKSVGSFYYENFAFTGMVPYKRPAADKSGMPVYQPSATTYQQLMQLQQPFVPVSCEYSTPPPTSVPSQPQQQLPPASSPATSVASSSIDPLARPNTTLPGVSTAATVTTAYTKIKDDSIVDLTEQRSLQTPTITVQAPSVPQAMMPDAAAIAKEVAQQNYAKKLAAVSNPLVMNPLAALNYTGVALNKQAVAMPPPNVPRYTHLPLAASMPHLAGLTGHATLTPNIGLSGASFPNTAAAAQQGLLQYSRPPPTIMTPYLLRQHYPFPGAPYGSAAAAAAAAASQAFQQQLINQSLLAQLPPYSLASSTPATPTQSAATLAQSNNNNIVMQPYKKMKTT